MAKFFLVDVVAIKSNKERSTFPEESIENLARSILESGCLLKPLVLFQTDIESYEVVCGHLEFYAAKRAREIDPRKGEMVGAFVFSKELPGGVENQISLLENQCVTPPPPEQIIHQRLTNLEKRLDLSLEEIKTSHTKEIQHLEKEISELKNSLPSKMEALEAFNSLPKPILARRLYSANIKGKTAEKIISKIEQERAIAPFISVTDIVQRVYGLGDKRMLSLIDVFNGIY